MKSLELKVPPPAVALGFALLMWAIASFTPALQVAMAPRVVLAIVLALAGVAFSLAGIVPFHLAGTTVNPLKPDTASSLVTSGVYRITRNPMYLGLVFVLVALAVLLASAWALLGVIGFMLFIGQFQIAPEERALSARFGSAYAAYRSSVRRWL